MTERVGDKLEHANPPKTVMVFGRVRSGHYVVLQYRPKEHGATGQLFGFNPLEHRYTCTPEVKQIRAQTPWTLGDIWISHVMYED